MTTEQLPPISVIDPISPAIERVRTILFKPFDLRKWFVIGFCAWLAYLGQGGGGGGGGRIPTKHDLAGFHHAKDFIIDNLPWLIPAAIIGIMLMIIIWLVITWLSSRGKFMFLHSVAANRAEVKVPWRKFRGQGNNLFVFRLVAGLISFLCLALLVGSIIGFIILCAKGRNHTIVPFVAALIFLVPVAIIVGITFALFFKFTYDFVVPIMFLRTVSCTNAWREFLTILSANKARFTLYILFQIVIAIVIGAILMTAACITCCCAACILAIPYIGTVLMLPLLVFKRAYSLFYLRQFGPEFDVFGPEIAG
ncbi:MAG: DUF7544 domain-containing protein [Planctomycetota bacterium]|jgi:hypothetical protein